MPTTYAASMGTTPITVYSPIPTRIIAENVGGDSVDQYSTHDVRARLTVVGTGAPLVNAKIWFQITMPDGNGYGTFVAYTNAQGYATFNVSPIPVGSPLKNGMWSASMWFVENDVPGYAAAGPALVTFTVTVATSLALVLSATNIKVGTTIQVTPNLTGGGVSVPGVPIAMSLVFGGTTTVLGDATGGSPFEIPGSNFSAAGTYTVKAEFSGGNYGAGGGFIAPASAGSDIISSSPEQPIVPPMPGNPALAVGVAALGTAAAVLYATRW